MARTRSKKVQIDWSTFSNNIKFAMNPSQITPVNSDNNISSAAITFTVETACLAFVTVSVGVTSTTDYELKPEIWLDGAIYATNGTPASLGGGTSGRAYQRTISRGVSLSAGAHTLTPGVLISSATGPSIPAGAAEITAIVLGNVTA